MHDFLLGVSYLSRGFRMLWAPGLRRYVGWPIAVNVVVFALLFWLAGAQFQQLLDWLLPDPERFADSGFWQQLLHAVTLILSWLLWPLFILASAVVMFYTFTLVANLIGSPFNGMLAAQVERLQTGQAPPSQDVSLAAEIALAVVGELRKYAYFLKLALPLLLLFLIPGLNLLASVLWALFGAWAIALEYLDYPMGNHGHRFRDQRRLLARRRPLALGFGAALLTMTLIPGLNLLAMPTGVIAATLLWTEQRQRLQDPLRPS